MAYNEQLGRASEENMRFMRGKYAMDEVGNGKDDSEKILLKGTLSKSYLPKERIGKPSKWATFYTLLAEKERE